MGKPNLLSRTPVVVRRCVCGSMEGETRMRTGCVRPAAPAASSSRRSSWKLSMTKWPTPHVDGLLDLVRRLVVAVEVHGREVDPRSAEHGYLPARDDVEPQPEPRDVARERHVDERLAGVDDAALGVAGEEGVEETLSLVAQRRLVEDIERRAELAGERRDVAAADLQVAVAVDGGGDGEHFRFERDGHAGSPVR